jgi:succinate dehydrogenase/fumarate reductase flavoprotein subunit
MLEVLKGSDIDGALHLHPEQLQFEEDIDALTTYVSELRKRLNLKTPIRISSTAHLSMDDVETDSNLKTVIDGLYVVGELVGGIHGANRLGGNALTACVVTAEKVAENILTYMSGRFREGVEEHIEEEVKHSLGKYRLRNGEYTPFEVRTEIRNIMWLKAGVIRNEESLKQCFEELLSIHEDLGRVRISSHEEVIKYSEMLNTLLTALAVTYSALLRKESRGAHFRLDYPEESSN